jgi:AcrR family transcriptional regulator
MTVSNETDRDMDEEHAKAPGIRALSKQRVRDDIIKAGLRLFGDHGYEAVSTQQIAAEAGVTQRTLFRYFPQKAQIIFDPHNDHLGTFEKFLDATLQPGVEPMDAIRSAFQCLAVHFDANREQIAVVCAIMMRSSELRAIESSRQERIDRLVAFALDGVEAYQHRHEPGALPSLPSRIRAAVIFATARPTIDAWLAGEIKGSLMTYSLAAWVLVRPTLDAAEQFAMQMRSAFDTIDG